MQARDEGGDGIALVGSDTADLARLITLEHGKTLPDAAGEVQRGLEVIEFACGAPYLLKGQHSHGIGGGIDHWSQRMPLGVVAVAPSDGLAAVLADTAAPFREYGAFRIVRGGQSANPSTGELLEAVQAIQAGASEYLIKPVSQSRLELAIRRAIETANLRRKIGKDLIVTVRGVGYLLAAKAGT